MNLQTVTTTDVQRNFKRILDADEVVVVMRDSQPKAVVLPYEEYVRITENERNYLDSEVKKMLDEVHAANADISEKELDALIKEALHAAGRD